MSATPAHVRVMRRVTVHPDGCWLYVGPLDPDGYGMVSVTSRAEGKRTTTRVHRAVYEAHVGAIPAGLVLDHLCRVRNCVNPKHLEPVTNGENILRGETVFARNAARTHCPAGHPYSGPNLFSERTADGRVSRKCRACRNARTRRWRAQQREAS